MAQKKKQIRKAPRLESEEVAPVVSSTVAAPGSSRMFSAEFNPDYSQTIKDLKRIAILAGSFFVVLVVLAFILP